MNKHLAPFRVRRAKLDENPQAVWDVLHDGSRRARLIAEQTMMEVREAVGLTE